MATPAPVTEPTETPVATAVPADNGGIDKVAVPVGIGIVAVIAVVTVVVAKGKKNK